MGIIIIDKHIKPPTQELEYKSLCCYGNTYILVTKVEDKLFAAIILAPGSCCLRQGNVELQRGVGGQVGQVRRSPDLDARSSIKFHRNTNLWGRSHTRRKSQKTCEVLHCYVIVLECVWRVHLAGSVAGLLDELSDVVDVLRDVWGVCTVVLQFVQFLHEKREGLPQRVD